jgi:glycogenin
MRQYLTLISSKNYLEGVLVLNYSLKKVGSKYPLTVLVSIDLYKNYSKITEILTYNKINFLVLEIKNRLPIEVTQKICSKRWINTFDKLQVFGLTTYSKIVFLDSDMLVVKNIDHLFEAAHLSFATASEQVSGCEDWILPNSGMMVIVPQKGLPERIFEKWEQVHIYKKDFSDQDLIQAYFADRFNKDQSWRVPAIYNCFVFLIDKIVNERNYNLKLRNSDEKTISVLHFAIKERPWLMSKREIFIFYLSKFFNANFYEMKSNYLYLLHLAKVRELNRYMHNDRTNFRI